LIKVVIHYRNRLACYGSFGVMLLLFYPVFIDILEIVLTNILYN